MEFMTVFHLHINLFDFFLLKLLKGTVDLKMKNLS